MSADTKPTTRKQKLLIALIIVTAGLLVVSLMMGGGSGSVSDSGIDRETCLQRGNVWDNTRNTCFSSSATRLPQSFLADCSQSEDTLRFELIDDRDGQIIFPDSPAQAFLLSETFSGDGRTTYESMDASVTVNRSGNTITVRRENQVVFDDCDLRANNPPAPVGTELTRLSVNQTAQANGVMITLNSIVADNRCPVDAVCINSGNLRVNTTLQAGGLQEQPSLRTRDAAYQFADRRVAVTGAVPAKVSDRDLVADNYLVTFWVTRSE